MYRTFVCPECAGERARAYTKSSFDFERILARMDRGTSGSTAYTCRLCGSTLADIVVDGRPGCCLCYLRFAGEIDQSIISAQGRAQHVGKAPEK